MKTEIFRAECLNVKLELAKRSQDSIKVAFEFLCTYHFYFLLIKNPRLCLHQFLGTKTTEANKSLKTDANGAY